MVDISKNWKKILKDILEYYNVTLCSAVQYRVRNSHNVGICHVSACLSKQLQF
jgi:hypothetical protein